MKKLLFIGLFIVGLFPMLMLQAQVEPPVNLRVNGYERHNVLRWEASPSPNLAGYRIYRSKNGGASFQFIGATTADESSYLDYLGTVSLPSQIVYGVKAYNQAGDVSELSVVDTAFMRQLTDEELMDMVQEATFYYFWDHAHPVSGMARERLGSGETVTAGGTGFGIMAILVGIHREFITREEGLARIQKICNFLENADRFHGAWPHWMNGTTGKVIPFSTYDNGGDLVETAFLVQGLLTARAFFDGEGPEAQLRSQITALWKSVEWDWYSRGGNVLYWHWSPNYQWQMNMQIRGFNETMIVYLLAIASPTHSVPASLYHTGWAGASYYLNGKTFYGYKIDVGWDYGGPLFFTHYSYLGFDPRNKKDKYTNYFINNRNIALIHHAYCVANPQHHEGYSDECWGLTASDDPDGYAVHEPIASRDNGTISPTAALSSFPYTPEESMKALRYFYRNLPRLWGKYGFYDAFNQERNWWATSYLAIDQGPIVCMIENYRSGLLWEKFMSNPEINPALQAIGFINDPQGIPQNNSFGSKVSVFPNPVIDQVFVSLESLPIGKVQLRFYNSLGQLVLENTQTSNDDGNVISCSVKKFKPGVYWLKISMNDIQYVTVKVIKL
ncbi:MAG: glucoamylase family protein [Bacteroidales bacterium]